MVNRSTVIAGLCALLAVLSAARLRAQPAPPAAPVPALAPPLELHWRAPEGCPQEPSVSFRVQQLTGMKRLKVGLVFADGTVIQTDDGRFHLTLLTHVGELVGERNIESKSCEQLAGAAAVALSLLLQSGDPNGTPANDASSTGTSERQDASTRAGDAGSTSTREGENDSTRGLHARLQLPLLALGIGPLSRPSFGLALGGGVSYRDWGFSLQLVKWLRQDLFASEFPGYGADVERATASVAACRAFRRDVFEIAPCLVMSVEHLSASGFGERVLAHEQSATLFSLGAGAQARVYFTDWFALTATVAGQAETSRPQISIAGVGDIERLGPAAFTVLVGSEWIL